MKKIYILVAETNNKMEPVAVKMANSGGLVFGKYSARRLNA
ncbi:MAG TPA: hypothetical protein VG367_05260 [Mucilaginibacter sp.]|jgi:hypothetical protein|nr:hypothetical protein [Mucilaginibacter sp.]